MVNLNNIVIMTDTQLQEKISGSLTLNPSTLDVCEFKASLVLQGVPGYPELNKETLCQNKRILNGSSKYATGSQLITVLGRFQNHQKSHGLELTFTMVFSI